MSTQTTISKFVTENAGPNALAFLATSPAAQAKYEASEPYRFGIDCLDHPGSREALPQLLEDQAFGNAAIFSLGSTELQSRLFGVQIVDPALQHPENEIVWSDEVLAQIQGAPSWTAKSALMKRLVVEAYLAKVKKGQDPYTGVSIKLRLTGIMNDSRQMTPQGGPKGQDLADGFGWLAGHRSPTLNIGTEQVAAGLFTESEYRGLHHYASLLALLTTIEGENAAYSAGNNSSLRQYLAAGPKATIQFQLVHRPKSQRPEDEGLFVPGLMDVAFSGFNVLGVFSGGAVESPRAVTAAPTVEIDAPFPAFTSATPAEEALATPAGIPF